jgi:hypothetical protein
MPFEAEVAFAAALSVLRNHRQEERAVADALLDRRVPGVAAAQLAFVEPHLEPGAAQRIGDAAGSVGVFVRVAQEDGARRGGWGGRGF